MGKAILAIGLVAIASTDAGAQGVVMQRNLSLGQAGIARVKDLLK